MMLFQQKVAELKRIESTVYTICLSLTEHEQAACAAAERALTALFRDEDYWRSDEQQRNSYIVKLCLRIVMERPSLQRESVPSA